MPRRSRIEDELGDDPEGPSDVDIDRFSDESRRCPSCGAEVYDEASVCPICLNPLEATSGKPAGWVYLVVILLVGIMAFGAVAWIF